MAKGDKAPDWVYKVEDTGNGYWLGSDRKIYNQYGYESDEPYWLKKERLKKEAREARPQSSGPSIFEEGMQKMGSDITDTFHETNRQFGRGILATIIIGLLAAFGITYSNEMKKDPGNAANATSKGIRNVLCVIGILAIIAVLCIVTFGYAMIVGDEPSQVGKILLTVFTLCGYYGIFGLIRMMMNKTFFIHFKKMYHASSDAKPLPKWAYILIEFGSIVVLYKPIYNVIENIVFEKNPDLIFAKSWLPDQYYEVGIKIFAGSVGLAALAGILICLIVRFVRKHF